MTKRIHGFVPQFGTVQVPRHISPGRNVQVQPYSVRARARFLDKDAVALRGERDARLGLDAKLVVRDALTLDTTVHPDFSQIESDDPQVTINERFEVFFPEKRRFFIENAAFFQTPINLFFCRRGEGGENGRYANRCNGPNVAIVSRCTIGSSRSIRWIVPLCCTRERSGFCPIPPPVLTGYSIGPVVIGNGLRLGAHTKEGPMTGPKKLIRVLAGCARLAGGVARWTGPNGEERGTMRSL